ncbi:MAG: trypsin-like peptidase domain-containing protein [Saprospiraceae bacterium]|nr:trypsin-like peptidase domain-containing protein [Saprospiraceae bacterium]
MFKGSNLRLLFGVLLLGGAFFAGVAWKGREDHDQTKMASEAKAVSTGNAPDESGAAREGQPNNNLTATEMATIKLFEEAAPSVCFITTMNVRLDYFTRDVTEIQRGTGSAFVWDNKGHIVTNYHVIQGADKAQVTLSDRSVWPAKLVGVAPEKDLAVLKIDIAASKLRPIPVGISENLRVGQSVYAIGNPFGLDQTLTTGVVSALGREIQSVAGIPIRDVIQSDAAINPGNSGGPLLDSSGKLIGVNTAIYSPSGASAGIGFSIPVDVVRWVVPELIQYGKVKRPSLGVELARQQIVQRLGLEGALVLDVIKNSAAERAGIQPTYRDRSGAIRLGDIIVGINNEKITSNNDLYLALEQYNPGESVKIKLLRDERPVVVELKLDTAQ